MKKICALVLPSLLTLVAAAPSQAASTVSPDVLDFGTFSASAPPSTLLSSTVTPDATNPYVVKVWMVSGGQYFFPSGDCIESAGSTPCTVRVRVVTPLTATGPLSGTIGIGFGDVQSDYAPVKETKEIQVRANVVPTTAPGGPSGTGTPSGSDHSPKTKKGCKQGKGKKKGCGHKKKGKKGKGKGKGKH